VGIAAGVCLIIAWIIALFTGQWNPALNNF
jgi:hypothetical protein